MLDVGCGAGDNAKLLKTRHPNCEIFGITHSVAEADVAVRHMTNCWVLDIEAPIPAPVSIFRFDSIVFSHVLEHLRDPADVLTRFAELLDDDGSILIAVPNVLSWRMRWKFLRGRFEYQSSGTLDDTHLRFFTFQTAVKYLFSKSPALTVVSKSVTGNVPLWIFRRFLLPRSWCQKIDEFGCCHWPNLFGDQVLLRATIDRNVDNI